MKSLTNERIATIVGRVLLVVLASGTLLWVLPWILSLSIVVLQNSFTVFYSSLADAFIISRYDDISEQTIYESNRGERYTSAEHDSILPLIYFRSLQAADKLPKLIKGERITYSSAQEGLFSFHSNTINVVSPRTQLNILVESIPGHAGLEQPDDVFRFTRNGIEFVSMTTKQVNERKSELFTWLMNKEKVAFPIKTFAGNGTYRKDYDNGVFFVDGNDDLFHMRLVGGHPALQRIPKPQALKLEYLFVTEFKNRKWLGFVFDTEGQMWTIDAADYRFRPVGIPPVNLREQNIFITGTQLSWTVFVSSPERSVYYAVSSKDLKLIDIYEPAKRELSWKEKLYNALPKIKFLSEQSRKVRPYWE